MDSVGQKDAVGQNGAKWGKIKNKCGAKKKITFYLYNGAISHIFVK